LEKNDPGARFQKSRVKPRGCYAKPHRSARVAPGEYPLLSDLDYVSAPASEVPVQSQMRI
jgi:hypothetical protein